MVANPAYGDFTDSPVFEFDEDGKAEIVLDGSREWRLSLDLEGYWARDQIVDSSSQRNLEFQLFATGQAEAEIILADDVDQVPGLVEIGFQAARDRHAGSYELEGAVQCPIRERRLMCEIPAAELDLRLEVPGYVPIYLWSARLQAGEKNPLGILGMLKFRKGSSLIGWVLSRQSQEEHGDPIRVVLKPLTTGENRSDMSQGQRALLHQTTTPNERGFFQISGIPPGSYVLTAEQPGFAAKPRRPIVIPPDTELELNEEIALLPLARLEVWLDPPFGPNEVPWYVRIQEGRSFRSGVRTVSAEGSTDLGGRWESPSLSAGNYEILVLDDTKKNTWLRRALEITPDIPPLFLDIDLIEIEGTVRLGEDPVHGTLWFGGRFAPKKIGIEADEEGRFHGYLTRAGKWAVDVAYTDRAIVGLQEVEVKPVTGRRVVHLDIELPNTHVGGRVVDQEGKGVAYAAIQLTPQDSQKEEDFHLNAQLQADREGVFLIGGLGPGNILIQAHDSRDTGFYSARQPVSIMEDREIELLHLIREEKSILMTVRSDGLPVADAHVFVVPEGDTVRGGNTDVAGRFAFSQPPVRSHVVIHAAGYPLHMFSLQPDSEGETTAIVDLGRAGGVLTLQLPRFEPGEGPGEDIAVIHNEVVIHLSLLVSAAQPHVDFVNASMTFAHVEVGEYRLCTTQTQRCEQGVVDHAGTLNLDLSTILHD